MLKISILNHENQTFGLMKIHNMCKTWFANKIFSLLRWNKKYFSWFFKGFQLLEIILRLHLYWPLKENFYVISLKVLRAAILWDIVARIHGFFEICTDMHFVSLFFSKWKKHYNLPFDDTFKMYCCALC